jgi:hypothetical protein
MYITNQQRTIPNQHHPGNLQDHFDFVPVPTTAPNQHHPGNLEDQLDDVPAPTANLGEFGTFFDYFRNLSSSPSIPTDTTNRVDADSDEEASQFVVFSPPQSPRPVTNEEQEARSNEETMFNCRRRVSERRRQIDELRQRIEELELANREDQVLEEVTARQYTGRLNVAQVNVFNEANRDQYLDVVLAHRRRRTIARTYADYHRFTRHL